MIIIFEGLDNCGKTTLVQMIKKNFDDIGIDAKISKEFETNIGKELKIMAQEGTLDSIIKAFLFATDRYIRMKQLNKNGAINKIILFDRYVPSALAYRVAEGVDKQWISGINSIFPKADIGFFIDITPEESIKRNTDSKFNIKATPEYLSKVRNVYLSILEENNLIHINGMRPIENIFEDIIKIIGESVKSNDKKI